ncbi:MAG: hypothetical protein ACK4MV_00355 [Beijerinckiaceae bacterium]
MNRLISAFLAASFALFAHPVGANEAVCSDRTCDEQQIGPYVAPDIALPDPAEKFDPRGKPIEVPGMNGVALRSRPGAGVWLGEAPGKANVFLRPARESVNVDIKLDF